MLDLDRFIIKHYLDVPAVLRISRYLNEPKSKSQIAEIEGMGEAKVRGLLEWARHLDVISLRKDRTYLTTGFGRAVNRIKMRYAYELLYWKLVRGHRAIQLIVNDFMYTKSRTFSSEFSLSELRQYLDRHASDLGDPSARDLKSVYLEAVNALTESGRGLGVLGLVSSSPNRPPDEFKINSYRPDWRAAAYILYESWPENVSRVRINEVVAGYNSIGRTFCLTEPGVMVLLSKLEQEHVIALEMIADLHQIGRNPAMSAQDFLEMLICDQS